MSIAGAIKRQREKAALSQKEFAARMKTSQPRIARIERAASDVSLDQLLRTFTAAGGKIVVKTAKAKPGKGKHRKSSNPIVLEVVMTE